MLRGLHPQLFDCLFDFACFREAAEFVLGEDELAVDAHVEDPVLTTDQFRLNTEALFE